MSPSTRRETRECTRRASSCHEPRASAKTRSNSNRCKKTSTASTSSAVRTREAVEMETPACAATSRSCTARWAFSVVTGQMFVEDGRLCNRSSIQVPTAPLPGASVWARC